MNIMVFWDLTMCNLVNHYQCFRGTQLLSTFSVKESAEHGKLAHIYRDGRPSEPIRIGK
jgi:hypothetical protein